MNNAEQTDRKESTGQPVSEKRNKLGVFKIIQSVLAGALGVQTSRRHEEDFNSGSPWPYIIGGLIFTGGFVLTLVLIVKWVLASQ